MIEIVLHLCPDCGSYEPVTEPGYSGQLSGMCTSCLLPKREVHSFIATVSPRGLTCSCSGGHDRRRAA